MWDATLSEVVMVVALAISGGGVWLTHRYGTESINALKAIQRCLANPPNDHNG